MPPTSRVLLRDQATDVLRAAIVSGEIAPGEVIKDVQLAERLGLSVAPVRVAIARLADEGLVEAKPRSHTRVTPLLDSAVRDAVVVVRAMHELATREAVPRLRPEDVRAMEDANARFARAVCAGDVDAALAADDALHGVLVDRCGNTAVRATVERFTPVIRRLERRRFSARHAVGSVDLHDLLIAACASGNVNAAAATTAAIWTTLLDELDPARDPEETP